MAIAVWNRYTADKQMKRLHHGGFSIRHRRDLAAEPRSEQKFDDRKNKLT